MWKELNPGTVRMLDRVKAWGWPGPKGDPVIDPPFGAGIDKAAD
jgi:hypothetical protein